MKTAKEILDEVTKGCGIVSEQYIIKAMECYAQYRVNQLNKSDIDRRDELLSAFSWVSSIGEQFFNPSKTVHDMVDAYEKSKR